MSTPEPRQSVRVVAFSAANVQHLRTVNIVSSKPNDPHHSIREFLQLTAAQTVKGVHRTLMAAGSVTVGLPTIYVNGYSGPN